MTGLDSPPFDATSILFCGDPHGNFDPFRRAGLQHRPQALVLLGDYNCLQTTLVKEIAPVRASGIPVHWITGNHDTDSVAEWVNLHCADGCIDGQVVTLAGLRVAGLGGVFRAHVWHPGSDGGLPRFRRRDDFLLQTLQEKNNKFRAKWTAPWESQPGLPVSLRGAIWPEDYDQLADQQADILVTHEAPACHRHGFAEIDLLAEAMGARLIVHGHHHTDYRTVLPNGIVVHGVGRAGVQDLHGRCVMPGLQRGQV